MPAFNTRLKSKEIFGMPFAAAIGLAVALIFFVLSPAYVFYQDLQLIIFCAFLWIFFYQ